MKWRFIISIIIIAFVSTVVLASNGARASWTDTCFCQKEFPQLFRGGEGLNVDFPHSPSLSDTLTYSTALINSLNNTIAVETKYINVLNVLVAVFALLVAIVTVLTFFGIKGNNTIKEETKNVIRDHKEEIKNIISGYENKMNDWYDEIKKELKDNIKTIGALNEKNNGDLKEYKCDIEKTVDGIKEDLKDKINEINSLNDRNEGSLKDYKREIKELVDLMDKELSGKIEEINRLSHFVDEKAIEIENLGKKFVFQNRYLQRINEYLYSITNTVVDNTGVNGETRSRDVKTNLLGQYYIVKAFLPWSDDLEDGSEAVFRYLQNNGIKDHIKDLQFIAENDPEEKKRNIALITIGFIQDRIQMINCNGGVSTSATEVC